MSGVPASSHGGGLPSQWVAESNGALIITLDGASGDHDFAHAFRLFNSDGTAVAVFDSSGDVSFGAGDSSTHMSYASAGPVNTPWDTDGNFVSLRVPITMGGTAVHSAPSDGSLTNGQLALWYDQTNGAAKLMVKARTADGTLVSAAIALA